MAKKNSTKQDFDRLKEDLQQEIYDRIDNAKVSARELEQKAEEKIKEHPKKSVALSFGAGAIAGAAVTAIMYHKLNNN